jgi:Uma2 family endonuclease
MAQPLSPLLPFGAPRGPASPRRVRLVYEVEEQPERWLLDEDDMPETPLHHACLLLLDLILSAWVARSGRSAMVARNLACRWDDSDARVGVDPDLCLIEPAPPPDLKQLRLWEPGHVAPRLAFEIVSGSTAAKDYQEAPARYARLGTREVWVFDPLREGPSLTGGPFVLQGWRWNGEQMERVHAGDGPAWSEELGAWLVVTEGGKRLRVADDPEGRKLWPTEAEEQALQRQAEAQARQQAEAKAQAEAQARQQAEAAREAAERELAELRALLARSHGGG